MTGGAETVPVCGLCEWASVEITATFFNTSSYCTFFLTVLSFFAWTGEFINKQTRCLMSSVRRLEMEAQFPPKKLYGEKYLTPCCRIGGEAEGGEIEESE